MKLIFIKGGREIIESGEARVKSKVLVMRMMQADMEAVVRKHPEHEKPLKQVSEALKYSDPMSHASLWVYDEQIRQSISEISNLTGDDKAKIPAICETLLRQIADRNSMVRAMK